MTQPPGDHPDVEVLAELDEDLLDPATAATVRRHVDGCAECTAAVARITATTAALAALPATTMPPRVADRLDAALAGAASTVVPLTDRRRSWRSHPTTAGLGAAAAVTALVAAVVIGATHSHNSGSQSASTAPDATGAGAAQIPVVNVVTSGNHYTGTNIVRLVPKLLASGGSGTAPLAPAPSTPSSGGGTRAAGVKSAVPPALHRLHDDPAALNACILGVEKGGAIEAPLAVDFARYNHKPAVVIVLPPLQGSHSEDAWIVGADCNQTNVDLIDYKPVPLSG